MAILQLLKNKYEPKKITKIFKSKELKHHLENTFRTPFEKGNVCGWEDNYYLSFFNTFYLHFIAFIVLNTFGASVRSKLYKKLIVHLIA